MIKDILVFSLTSNVELTNKVCQILGIEASKSEVHHFADGECLATSLEDVRGKKVYIIQSTSKPVNDRIMETLIFIDGVKRANCREVTVIMPYYGYARQDRIAHINEPISAKLVADLFTNVGVKRVLTVELHTPQIQGFFGVPVDNLSPSYL
ncbi:MAG: ribose-phosphate diphosphokinase, partial [Candidatus Onthovivens sp.]|nr:ribose-phosphate diphosphokinase [Candidatus Onthovivens sp.]